MAYLSILTEMQTVWLHMLMDRSKYTIGIDLGGTTMTAGLVDEDYNIVGKITRPTRLPRPAQDLEQALADLCRAVAKDCKIDFADVSYVGIGTPGSVNFTTGFVGYNTNFGYYDWNLGPDLEALLGCKVRMQVPQADHVHRLCQAMHVVWQQRILLQQ